MRTIQFFIILIIIISCEQPVEKVRGIPSDSRVEGELRDLNATAEELKKKGHHIFTYEEEDTTYLMQQYYIVFLKKGENSSLDSAVTAKLQKQHMAYLTRMHNEGYASLAGPMGDDGEIRGIVIFNTATLREADSLARLDPMVKAGRLKVEVLPWWVSKGSKLN